MEQRYCLFDVTAGRWYAMSFFVCVIVGNQLLDKVL